MSNLPRLYIVVRNFLCNQNFRQYDLDRIRGCLSLCPSDQVRFLRSLDDRGLVMLHRSSRGSDAEMAQKRVNVTSFLVEAFKGLSAIKNPHAMLIFRDLYRHSVPSFGPACFVWARKIKKRSDGSAVVILHVSDLQRFEESLRGHRQDGSILEGLPIY